jgi:tetratricopeptide (TPR) repeat protein
MKTLCLAGVLAFATAGLGSDKRALERHLKNAQALIDQEKYGEAVPELAKAVSLEPALPGAYYQLGYCYWKLNQLQPARRAFERELEFFPPDPHSLYYLGRISAAEGDTAAAIRHFEKAAQIGAVLDVYERLGSAYLRDGKLEAAILWLEKAVRQHPERGEPHYLLGRAYLRAGRTSHAHAQFSLTRKLKTEDRQAIEELVRFDQHLKRNEVRAALEIAGRLSAARDPEVLLATGRLLGTHGLHTEALRTLELAAALQPSLFEARFNMGVSLLALNRGPRAIEALTEAVRLRPDSYEAQLLLGTALIQEGKDEAAIRHLRAAAAIRGDDARLLALLGLKYTEGRYYREAIETLSRALKVQPQNAEIRFLLIQAHDQNQDYEKALELARETLALFPKLPRSHFEAGLRLHNMGRSAEAQPHLEAAISLDPSFAEAHAMLGDILSQQGKSEASLSHYRTALQLRPNLPDAYSGMGKTLLQLKRYDEVVAQMQKAVALDPAFPQPYLYLSQSLRALGRAEEARRAAEEFSRLNRRRIEQRDREVERAYVP